MKYIKMVCLVIFIFSFVIRGGLLQLHKKSSFLLSRNIKIISIEEADSPELTSTLPEYSEDIEKFKEILPVFDESMDDVEKAKELLGFIGNSAEKVGNEITSKSPFGMYLEMKEGKAVYCAHMALVYLTMLKAKGVNARKIQLKRILLFDSYDTHVTVEVYSQKLNKWVIMDPTFNVYFLVEGIPASATDLHTLLLENNVSKPKDISVIKVNEVIYPADIKKYYINPLLLYNHIYFRNMYIDKRRVVIIPVSNILASKQLLTPIIFLNSLFYRYTLIAVGLSFIVFVAAFIADRRKVKKQPCVE